MQAPLDKDVHVSMPALFLYSSGINPKTLCLKLHESLYGMKEAPKLWNDFLQKALIKGQFTVSEEDAGVYYGSGMTITVYVDDVLFFGPPEAEMEDVINEFETDGFELKRETLGNGTACDLLGINISREN